MRMYEKKVVVIDECGSGAGTVCAFEQLQKAGFFNLSRFTKTSEFLAAISGIRPDLIISDIYMPDIDGWQLCKILQSKEYSEFNQIPIILISTLCKDANAEKLAFEAGACAVLQAPYERQDLISLISCHLKSEGIIAGDGSMGFKKKILIADDDVNILQLFTMIFKKENYEVYTASDGKKAIESIEKTKPHIVLLDYQMPVMNGMEVLKWLKKNFPQIASVALTAYGSETVAINFMKEGADDYISKPFENKKVIETCNAAFNKYNVRLIGSQFKKHIFELAKTEEKYHAIVDNSSDLIYILDDAGKFSFVNREVEAILGFKAEEMLGMPFTGFICQEDISQIEKHTEKRFFEHRAGERSGKKFEVRMLCNRESNSIYHGNTVTLEIAAKGLYSVILDSYCVDMEIRSQGLYLGDKPAKKFFKGTIGIARNVTERKLMQERLFHAEKLSSIGTLVSGIAHELNNPLTAISGFVELLMGESTLSDLNKKDMEIIFNESQRCIKTVQGLLSFSRKHKVAKKLIEINEVVQKALEFVGFSLKSNGIALHVDLEKSGANIFGDSHQLQQVFLNILNNAVYAVRETTSEKCIWVKTEVTDGKWITVTFKNSGHPISDELVRKIFDPFFTTKGVGKGTGLGLSISHGIISDHGGTIKIENLSEGVIFHLEFPFSAEQVSSLTAKTRKGKWKPIQGKHILLVEDEKGIRDFLGRALEKDGHHTVAVSNGKKALEMIKTETFDLVISDLRMPEMDGISFYNQLKEIRPELSGRFILITGAIEDEVYEFSERTGNPYIQKPFQRSELRKLLSEVFDEEDQAPLEKDKGIQ